ncbi:uncharacterized protein AKAW2_60945S [Aspergillus luchuensis]|uniref:Uncharacterized protein n=1 Tax=Aspergillus kawachii TaxID=1069201 RepID=A0A7R8A1Z7_ASPKA|nr:uncharacterized protein AKAW2_60945S [Aspergillus luchuensis]BCS02681.1 hypothetical protein AKAW2_60945S [Aspergillus luchuensis]
MKPVTVEELSTLYMNLARLGHAEVLLELLKHGADPNQQNGKKRDISVSSHRRMDIEMSCGCFWKMEEIHISRASTSRLPSFLHQDGQNH